MRTRDSLRGPFNAIYGPRAHFCCLDLLLHRALQTPFVLRFSVKGACAARSMESLQQVFYQRGLGQRLAALIVTAIMVPLSQARPPPPLGSHVSSPAPAQRDGSIFCGGQREVACLHLDCNDKQGYCISHRLRSC